MGVSVARNIGINKSNGDYIVFVDPDDTVAPDLISSLFRKIEGNSFDMVIYGFDTQYGDREEKSVTLPKLSRDLFGNEAIIECLLPHYIGYSVEHVRNWLKSGIFDNEKEFGSIWRVAYRRDFLLDYDIYFDKDIFYNEDEIFNSMCISQAESVGVLPMNLYHYVIRSSGVMMRGLADKLVHNRIALLKAREKIVLNMEKNGIELFAGSTIFSIFEMMTLLEIDSWPDIKRYINFPSVQKSIRMMPIGSKLKYTVPVLLLKMRMYLILFVTIKLLKKIGLYNFSV